MKIMHFILKLAEGWMDDTMSKNVSASAFVESLMNDVLGGILIILTCAHYGEEKS